MCAAARTSPFAAAAALLAAAALVTGCGDKAGARVYWGAQFGGMQYGLPDAPWSMRSVDRFAAAVGKRPSLVQFSLPWAICTDGHCDAVPFPTAQMQRIRAAGAIPVLGWASYAQPVSSEEPDFQLADVVSGRYDAYIRSWARAAKAWGRPFFLRFDWEMNLGSWPYVETQNGNRPGEFVAMWRHVHAIFREVGADDVTWVWCPNVEYGQSIKPLSRLYPGDDVVDWTCLDGYNWGTNPIQPSGWLPFEQLFGPTYRLVTEQIAPRKPLMIAETASSEQGGSKAGWLRDMLEQELPSRFPRVDAVLYNNRADDGLDWPIESSASATSAFASGIRLRRYAGARFGSIKRTPIAPLR